jgi:hypothetical protein
VVFLPIGEQGLASIPGLSVGIVSASQGSYSQTQLLLDISQGARIATSAYPQHELPRLSFQRRGGGALIGGWPAALRRAHDAPQILSPGLLAESLRGGAGYAAAAGAGTPDAVLAADQNGQIAAVSLGSAPSLLTRVHALLAHRRLVIADLLGGSRGREQLRRLSASRSAQELLIVMQRSSDPVRGELLWSAVAGLTGGGGRTLSSQSTNERGLIASIDIATTILRHLGIATPVQMRGKPIEADGALDQSTLRAFAARLRVVGGRRLSTLGFLLAAWALLICLCSPSPRARARALRVGGLGVLWAPVAVLAPALFMPSAAVEYLTVTLLCLALGAASDLLIPWPRALLAPAVVGVLALTVDALAHTQLLVRSMLGPNPILGARFYGIGNEIKSGLAVLVLAAVASALYPTTRGRRGALVMACAGVLLAAIEGSARIGAGVGGVILVSAGFAVALASLAGGALTRKRAIVVLVSPLLALLALAILDLLSAHGSGHYTGSILHASSPGELRDVIVRRYKAAWGELHNHAMPIATALALGCAAFAVRSRERLLAPVGGDAGWLAALFGGLTAGVVGAFSEDSGPVLLVVAVFALGCIASYLWGGEPQARAKGAPPRLLHTVPTGAVDHDLVL